jgi:hypothetical protein
VSHDAIGIDETTVGVLQAIAAYRVAHDITGAAPLGIGPPADDIDGWKTLTPELRRSDPRAPIAAEQIDLIDL